MNGFTNVRKIRTIKNRNCMEKQLFWLQLPTGSPFSSHDETARLGCLKRERAGLWSVLRRVPDWFQIHSFSGFKRSERGRELREGHLFSSHVLDAALSYSSLKKIIFNVIIFFVVLVIFLFLSEWVAVTQHKPSMQYISLSEPNTT